MKKSIFKHFIVVSGSRRVQGYGGIRLCFTTSQTAVKYKTFFVTQFPINTNLWAVSVARGRRLRWAPLHGCVVVLRA